jgi:hypothetical protein
MPGGFIVPRDGSIHHTIGGRTSNALVKVH